MGLVCSICSDKSDEVKGIRVLSSTSKALNAFITISFEIELFNQTNANDAIVAASIKGLKKNDEL